MLGRRQWNDGVAAPLVYAEIYTVLAYAKFVSMCSC